LAATQLNAEMITFIKEEEILATELGLINTEITRLEGVENAAAAGSQEKSDAAAALGIAR
jgi:hypothetical protein